MGSIGKNVVDNTLSMLRGLPRVSLSNIRDLPGSKKTTKRGRGQHGGNRHGCGQKGSGQRQNFMRIGYETGNNPFYLRFPYEMSYNRGHHLRREYPPVSLLQLQRMIDTDRLDISKPIDLATICNTCLYSFAPDIRQFGVQLTDEGADIFKAKVNIEVQWATEPVIAAIERNGGVITTAYFDVHCLFILLNAEKFFKRGEPIPKRMLPPNDLVEYYTDPKNRGYLADPEKVSLERLVLSQKYGYKLPEIEKDPDYEMLQERKDPRQLFYGLEPGWVVNLKDKTILKPKDLELQEYYNS